MKQIRLVDGDLITLVENIFTNLVDGAFVYDSGIDFGSYAIRSSSSIGLVEKAKIREECFSIVSRLSRWLKHNHWSVVELPVYQVALPKHNLLSDSYPYYHVDRYYKSVINNHFDLALIQCKFDFEIYLGCYVSTS
jgi:hypothetical protein